MSELRCRICDQYESEHHAFEAIAIPDGCICDPGEWDVLLREIPAVCDHYECDGKSYCLRCEHIKACHKESR